MKVRTHITIEKEILDYAKIAAKRLGLSMSAYVGLLIARYNELKERLPFKDSTRWYGTKEEYDDLSDHEKEYFIDPR